MINYTIGAGTSLLALCLVMTSCKGNKPEEVNSDAQDLYHTTCNVAQAYIDSIQSAKDSTQVHKLMENFEQRIEEINTNVKSDTDYGLTEGENDTIALLLDRISEVRSARLKSLSVSGLTPTVMDTLPD